MTDREITFEIASKFDDLIASSEYDSGSLQELVRAWTDRPPGAQTDIIAAQLYGFYCAQEDIERGDRRYSIRHLNPNAVGVMYSAYLTSASDAWEYFLQSWAPSQTFDEAYNNLLELDSNRFEFDQWGVSFIGYKEWTADAMIVVPQYTCLLIKGSKLYSVSAETAAHAVVRAYIKYKCNCPDEDAEITRAEIRAEIREMQESDPELDFINSLDEADQTDDLEFLSEATLAMLRNGNYAKDTRKPTWDDELGELQL